MADERTALPTAGRSAVVALALGALTVGLGAACAVPGACGAYHDDGLYVVTAKALAEGRGYRLISLPGLPAQTKYPILYPAMLAGVWKVWPRFPENLVALHALTLLTAGIAVGLSYAYLVRFGYVGPRVAAAGCLVCATSPALLYFAGRLLSEMPFAALVVLALWAFDGLLRSPGPSRWRQFAGGLVMAAPLLCRGAGAFLLPAYLWVGWRHRPPGQWLAALGVLAVVVPWAAWNFAGRSEARGHPILGYYTDYLGWWAGFAAHGAGRFALRNAVFLTTSVPGVLFGAGNFAGTGGAVVAFLTIMTGMIGLAGIARIPRESRCLPACLGCYLALVLAWPWPPFRFVAPVAPLLAPILLETLGSIAGRFVPSRPLRLGSIAVVALAVAVNLGSLASLRDVSRRHGYPFGTTETEPVDWASFEHLFDWIKERTRPDDVIASGLDPTIYLYTGRLAYRPVVARPFALFYGEGTEGVGSCKDLDRSLDAFGARYLVRTPLPSFAEEKPFDRLIEELDRREPGRLEQVYQGEDPRFVVYAIRDRPPVNGSGRVDISRGPSRPSAR